MGADLHEGLRMGALVAALALGFRHGIDWDHLAAITDLTTSASSRRRGIVLATLYALGHALVVLLLGIAVIAFGVRLPAGADEMLERLVGATLMALGAWVVVSFARQGRAFRLQSRGAAVTGLARGTARRLRRLRPMRSPVVVIEHEHPHDHSHHDHAHPHPQLEGRDPTADGDAATTLAVPAPVVTQHSHRHVHVGHLPDDPLPAPGRWSALVIGMVHGVGAETPTQVVVLAAAAGAGGAAAGVAFLAVFLVGLVLANTSVAVLGASGALDPERFFGLYAAVTLLVAAASLVIGTELLLGNGADLPQLGS